MQTSGNEITVKAARARSTRAQGDESFSPAVWACWAYILVAVGRIHELIPGLYVLPLAKLAVATWVLALFAADKNKVGNPPLLESPFYRSALVLAVLAVVSVAFSIWPGQSLSFVLNKLSVLVITVILMGKTLTDWRAVRGTWICLVVAGAGLAVQGMRAYGGGRLTVDSMYDPNDLAYVLVTVLPLAAAFASISRGWRKIAFHATAFLLLSIVLLTQSRGGVLAMIAMAIVYLRFLPKPKPKSVKGRVVKGKSMAAAVIAGVFVFGAAWLVMPAETKERISTIFSLGTDYNTDMSNKTGRLSMWTRNLGGLVRRPIGFGVDASPMADLRNGGKFKAVHNSLLQVGMELGFIGLFFYLRAQWVSLRDLRGIAAREEDTPEHQEKRILLRAVCVGLVGNIVAGFFLTMAYVNLPWVLMASMAVAAMLLGDPKKVETAPSRRRSVV